VRILLCSPEAQAATGNANSARRYQALLQQRGHQVEVLLAPANAVVFAAACQWFQPEVLLLIHAWRSGRLWLESGRPAPALVVLSGTDVNHGLDQPDQAPVIRQVLQAAAVVAAHNPQLLEQLGQRLPQCRQRLHVLPVSVQLGRQIYSLQQHHGIDPTTLVLLCPAGLRPVKGVLDLLHWYNALPPDRLSPPCLLAFCGPVLDETYSRCFLAAVRQQPLACYLGVIAPDAMADVLRQSALVINHSESEGLSGALLEAACLGRPILARDIPGNRALVQPGVNGLLYREQQEFHRHLLHLVQHASLRQQLSRPQPQMLDGSAEGDALEQLCRLTAYQL
jgi:glycosyltransferase involved in cell wall biosynthesis